MREVNPFGMMFVRLNQFASRCSVRFWCLTLKITSPSKHLLEGSFFITITTIANFIVILTAFAIPRPRLKRISWPVTWNRLEFSEHKLVFFIFWDSSKPISYLLTFGRFVHLILFVHLFSYCDPLSHFWFGFWISFRSQKACNEYYVWFRITWWFIKLPSSVGRTEPSERQAKVACSALGLTQLDLFYRY